MTNITPRSSGGRARWTLRARFSPPASDGEVKLRLGKKIVILRIFAVMHAVEDHRIAPAEDGATDDLHGLAFAPGGSGGRLHEGGPESRYDRNNLGYACDLGGGDARDAAPRRLHQNGVGTGIGEDRAQLAHPAVFVPQRELRRKRVGLCADVSE